MEAALIKVCEDFSVQDAPPSTLSAYVGGCRKWSYDPIYAFEVEVEGTDNGEATYKKKLKNPRE